jgi:hypothetical protein
MLEELGWPWVMISKFKKNSSCNIGWKIRIYEKIAM